jgi:uncharacterized protein YkwD
VLLISHFRYECASAIMEREAEKRCESKCWSYPAIRCQKMCYAKSLRLFDHRHLISAAIVSLALSLLTGCGKSSSKGIESAQNIQGQPLFVEGPASIRPTRSNEVVQKVYQGVNGYRISHGLRPLALNPLISQVATAHSREMAGGEIPFGHDGFQQRVRTLKQSFSFSKVAENIGYNMGYADPASKAVNSWLHSPKHLENIEDDFGLTGIGVAKSDKGEYYFTQIFLK